MIKEMIESERPRERALNKGLEYLSNEELLSIILKTGTKNISVKTIASAIMKEFNGIEKLNEATINKLIKIKGVGKVKALELVASLELGKRVYLNKTKENITLNNSTKVFEYFKELFVFEKQENFYAIYLDSKSKLISHKLLFKGTLNTSCVHPREIFKYALLESAYSIIVIHNHPSNDVTPSKPDIEVTNILFNIGKIMSLPVIDHIIIGKDKYYSFYENMNKK